MGRTGRRTTKEKLSKIRFQSKPVKKIRDFRHVEQRKGYEAKRAALSKITAEDDEGDERPDTLAQLMATFSSPRWANKRNVVDSDSDETSDDEANNEMSEETKYDEIDTTEHMDDGEGGGFSMPNEEVDNENDPFVKHFTGNLTSSLLMNVQANPKNVTAYKLHCSELKSIKVEIPVDDIEKNTSVDMLDEQEYVKSGEVPKIIQSIDWEKLHVKSHISSNVKTANKPQFDDHDELSRLQMELFSIMNNYQDVFYPYMTFENMAQVRFAYCLHVVNHILKSRLKVMHHNDRMKQKGKVDVPEEYRDQGLVRPKILILAPFRDSCLRIVRMISAILFNENKGNVINQARFEEEFTGSELFMPKKHRKPEDFEHLFHGNVDDSYRIGLSFTKKSLKLFSDFYSSDVIIASPLGIRMLIGAEGDKDRDFDFLAAIEVLILDQADVFLMQNWDHVVHIMNHMHMQPRETHGTDFSRVRLWALQGWARYYRQTLMFSSIVTPELNSLFSRHCANYAGFARIRNRTAIGSISHVIMSLPHVFRRFKCTSAQDAADGRFQYMINEVLPQFSDFSGILLYVPSYFDFVRLRNHLKAKGTAFGQICEYSKEAKVARARDMFYHREIKILLYSERFHFHRRVNIKGIRHLVFYQPPTYPHFYSEVCNMVQDVNQMGSIADGVQSVTVLFSKYDVYALTGIIRDSRAAHIVSSNKSVFMFTTSQ